MTEAEWLSSENPAEMLGWLLGGEDLGHGVTKHGRHKQATDRKLRLFACAIESMFEGRQHDGEDDWAETLEVYLQPEIILAGNGRAVQAALLREVIGNPFRPIECRQIRNPLGSDLARFASVGRLPDCDCAWITPTAVAIAGRAYEDRDWEALPVLADALEEVGCDCEVMLRHLRGEELIPVEPVGSGIYRYYPGTTVPLPEWGSLRGPHCRGCWAVDVVLGKR